MEERRFYSKKDVNKIAKSLGVSDEDGIDGFDYIEFCQHFGNNIDIYMKFKDFVHQNEMSWKEFSDIKYGDFNNSYITIPKKENIHICEPIVLSGHEVDLER